jgi:hypothetical protein
MGFDAETRRRGGRTYGNYADNPISLFSASLRLRVKKVFPCS